jgi:hypothetical protein
MATDRTYNLPATDVTDSSTEVKNFFDKFFLHQITFPSNQIDAVIGFFLKRGFDESAARSTSIVLLNQARLENINPLTLVDSLKGLTDVQVSQVVTEVLNGYRDKRSALGYKLTSVDETLESRNIVQ